LLFEQAVQYKISKSKYEVSINTVTLARQFPGDFSTIGFGLLYAFIIVRLDRRELVWVNVTTNPTAEWIARQITEAFPWDEVPKYLLRDRDCIYGNSVTRRLRAMGIRDMPIAPASPWQNGFAERLIGSIRRECVDHFVVLGEAHLRRILRSYAGYYNEVRTHRSLDQDAPVSGAVQRTGIIDSRPILGGLHHHYVRVWVFGTHPVQMSHHSAKQLIWGALGGFAMFTAIRHASSFVSSLTADRFLLSARAVEGVAIPSRPTKLMRRSEGTCLAAAYADFFD